MYLQWHGVELYSMENDSVAWQGRATTNWSAIPTNFKPQRLTLLNNPFGCSNPISLSNFLRNLACAKKTMLGHIDKSSTESATINDSTKGPLTKMNWDHFGLADYQPTIYRSKVRSAYGMLRSSFCRCSSGLLRIQFWSVIFHQQIIQPLLDCEINSQKKEQTSSPLNHMCVTFFSTKCLGSKTWLLCLKNSLGKFLHFQNLELRRTNPSHSRVRA